ncbi:GntR family transcriptional regulator [Streptomyces sp. NPDC059785]|uniref:GntR family transcriptional regulator n=1 Tax=unclassified Streptomyces TaxID=2593676 RepID=UPI003659122C
MNGSRRPSHQEIADTLRERIRTGQLKAGDRLPTQHRLADEFGVERGTVRQALKTLSGDGLLTNVSKGSPPTVAEQPAAAETSPQPTLVALVPRLEAAFRVPHVRIDAVCLTAETLMRSMYAPIRLIEQGGARPESITARLVLPSRELKLLYPAPGDGWGRDEKIDAAVHARSMRQHTYQIKVLGQEFRRLSRQHGIPVSVSFRVVDNTPYQKVYLLNGTEALVAYYTIAPRTEEVDGVEMELRDAWGTQSTLFSFNKEHSARDQLFVDESQRWFDALWPTLEPYAPDA